MIKGGIDSVEKLGDLLALTKLIEVEQLTIRPVNKPDFDRATNLTAWEWTNKNCVTPEQVDAIAEFLRATATPLMMLQHGAKVYDFGGQNVCLTDCLTIAPQDDDLRQLIFFPDGHLRYDWQYPGAILL